MVTENQNSYAGAQPTSQKACLGATGPSCPFSVRVAELPEASEFRRALQQLNRCYPLASLAGKSYQVSGPRFYFRYKPHMLEAMIEAG